MIFDRDLGFKYSSALIPGYDFAHMARLITKTITKTGSTEDLGVKILSKVEGSLTTSYT
ncbi:MAG: hypothetical protein QXE02_05295 [Sulfolobales archaeon]